VTFLLALLIAQAGAPADKVRLCDKTNTTRCATVNADGSLNISGSISTSGAADTVGASATFNANAVCTSVPLAGQLGAGFFLAAGTLDGTLTPSLSEDAVPATDHCTGGNWTPSKFVDTSGNTAATIVVTNPNAFQQSGIATLAGSRCVRVCTTTYNSGSATGLVIATTVPSPPPAAGADVTDRAARLLGHVTVDSAPTTAVTAASLPLPSGAAKESGGNLDSLVAKDFATQTTLALIKAKTDNLDVAISTRTKPADTQTVSGTVSVSSLPNSPSQEHTTAGSPASVRLSDGAAFLDPRDVSDRAARLLGVLSTGSNVIGAVTQSGTWTVQPGNTANTTAWKVDASGTTVPISAVSLPLPTGASSDATVAETHAVTLGTIPTRQDMIAGSDYGYSCSGAGGFGACSQVPRIDANGNQYTGVTNIVRVQIAQPMNSLLQRCNAVRRTNCQP
jgi:hypothetical protein